MDRISIVQSIKTLAAENGGQVPGQRTFERATGIATSAWRGKYWARWSDAIAEAGLTPNKVKEQTPQDHVLHKVARLTLRLGHLPTYAETRLARLDDDSFPAHQVIQKRLGSKEQRVSLLRDLAGSSDEFKGLLQILPDSVMLVPSDDDSPTDGFVYLARMGKHYKIGKTVSVPRRHRELSIQLPETLTHIHSIRTDDPYGIEAYWHKRFEAKRANGEWFVLSSQDVRAFKKRKFM